MSAVHDHARWGVGDQIGAGHLITAEVRRNALGLVREGRLFELGRVIDNAAPRMLPGHGPYVISTFGDWRGGIRRRRALGAANDAGSNTERIEMTVHTGTHIDGLGHFTIGDRMYGGHKAEDAVGDLGLLKLGIENAPAFIVRAVLLDLAHADGGDCLEAGRAITAADLQRALGPRALRSGDVVLIRTGHARFYDSDPLRYVAGEPGIEIGAARWLTAQGVAAIGTDTMAVEVLPPVDPKVLMPVHQHCLVECGVYLIENMLLDELAAADLAEFCFILLPVKFRGATGSPARPVALV